jgi:hypothetical protein
MGIDGPPPAGGVRVVGREPVVAARRAPAVHDDGAQQDGTHDDDGPAVHRPDPELAPAPTDAGAGSHAGGELHGDHPQEGLPQGGRLG